MQPKRTGNNSFRWLCRITFHSFLSSVIFAFLFWSYISKACVAHTANDAIKTREIKIFIFSTILIITNGVDFGYGHGMCNAKNETKKKTSRQKKKQNIYRFQHFKLMAAAEQEENREKNQKLSAHLTSFDAANEFGFFVLARLPPHCLSMSIFISVFYFYFSLPFGLRSIINLYLIPNIGGWFFGVFFASIVNGQNFDHRNLLRSHCPLWQICDFRQQKLSIFHAKFNYF